jgi:iron(III) transport system ATP-binding protein
MAAVRLENISKRFGLTVAVDAVSLTIIDGELFFLLGPSGCGKTTVLRMIAGFTEPSGGRIAFGSRDVTHLPPNRRNTGMVFQSYALWPHMTVRENVGYGLRVRKITGPRRAERIDAALCTVRMEPYADRKPNQLSGGQQQRVALARALVVEPTLLLLDEPLSNLDAKLRLEMRAEIRRICTETGITTIYVTHDQKEALSMADRVAVLNEGRIVQVGTPRELYDRPASRFVAEFLGETNFLAATVAKVDGGTVVLDTPAGQLRSASDGDATVARGDAVTCSLRPESLRPARPGDHENRLHGTWLETTYLGETAQHRMKLSDGTTIKLLELNPQATPRLGEPSEVAVDPEDVVLLKA